MIADFQGRAKIFMWESMPGSGGLSAAANELEVRYAVAWARNVRADALLQG